ncbi:Mitochondrial matrix iron chaperone [Sporothrix curviconia]|uniref:ferroxidase n=1 Tax=Sporothrix curviconia TaxID=1260050 RepID=A0ABP0CEM0_9PEZI
MPRPALAAPSRICWRAVPAVSAGSRRLFSCTAPCATSSAFRPSASRLAQPPQAAAPSLSAYTPQSAVEPAEMTESEYHALADEYLDRLLVRLEDMQDAREDVDVEYASGVLTLAFTASEASPRPRTYVINKQPPNKQIWLSSPISGPKRYDWVLDAGATGLDAPGKWIYLKDGSALNDLLRDEMDVDLDADWEE